MAWVNVLVGSILLLAAIDRLNKMGPHTKWLVKLAGWLLALAGGIGILWPLADVQLHQIMPSLSIGGSALWLLVDRRMMA
jgi:hypothetical protein